MNRTRLIPIKLKNRLIRTAQVLGRSVQAGLTTVQYVEIQSKIDSAKFVRENLDGALLFSTRQGIQDYAADEAGIREGIVLEMGVYDGGSINRIASKLWKSDPSREVYGLDSFKGLEESWSSTDHYRSFDVEGIPPKSIHRNVKIIHGRVENVLENFLNIEKPKFALIHFDMDLYGPSHYALKMLLPYLSSGTLILFDELHGYPGWEFGEFKALNQLLNSSQYQFKAFGPIQALIEIN